MTYFDFPIFVYTKMIFVLSVYECLVCCKALNECCKALNERWVDRTISKVILILKVQ